LAAAAQPFSGGLPAPLHAVSYETPGDGAQLFLGVSDGVEDWVGDK
jgi:hypothetical protein